MCIEAAFKIDLPETEAWKVIVSRRFMFDLTGPFYGVAIQYGKWVEATPHDCRDNYKGWSVFPRQEDAVAYVSSLAQPQFTGVSNVVVKCRVKGWCQVGTQEMTVLNLPLICHHPHRVAWSVEWLKIEERKE